MKRSCFWLLAGGLIATSGFAGTPVKTAVVDTAQVATAMAAWGISVVPDRVEMAAEVRATRAAPALEVLAVEAWQAGIVKARLRCVKRTECLPFYVLVSGTRREDLPARIRSKSEAPREATRTPAATHRPWLVRSGEVATLVIEGTHLRLQLPVICLANGSAGGTIRVTTTDRKRTYRARVVAAGLLKGGI